MGYHVLARKWRPNRFGELVGQEHVVTAISNALDNDRLHHAYLFTGTRGVGKTTIARIFSKSLNCEQGLSSKPCGQCSTCKEIENGNFIDLLEIDAASRTKVEDTRELLDNVQYKPSRGRYKVYLIDEVHMLSKHSFNALLKTLEEPPPHVKFLLATTDPQKLPVTVLSRCLQFNLKALSRTQISQQLDFVLGKEGIQFEKEALSQLARAAQGSMRDALSLTDQAIAQGNGVVGLQIVTDMLGLMDKTQVLKLVHAVVKKDSAKVMSQVELMASQAPDFGLVLAEIMSLLHQIALTQFVPDACKLETISARAIFQLAKSVPAEQIQLLYQIALTGKKDLPHAADGRTGLEMTLLRMLAFCPNNLDLDALDLVSKTPEIEPLADQFLVPAPAAGAPSNTEGQVNQSLPPTTDSVPTESLPLTEQAIAQVAQVQELAEKNPPTHKEGDAFIAPETKDAQRTDVEQAAEVELFSQQQDIMAQAQDFGHQAIDYDQYQPVSLEEQSSQDFSAEYVDDNAQNNEPLSAPSQRDSAQVVETAPINSTADLIALRNKLKQSQRNEGEGAAQVKKSDSTPPIDLASMRRPVQEPDKQVPEPQVPEQLSSEPITHVQIPTDTPQESPATTIISDQLVDDTPPWRADDLTQDAPKASPFASEKTLVEADFFDPNAHLDGENVGDVTLDIPAFLPDNQKVIKALQVDKWSKLIEDMQVTALTKQLALHSAFNRTGDKVKLTLLETKAHLISDTARQQLQAALCLAFNGSVDLEIELGQPINTPYALQLKVNQVRQDFARQVVYSDPGIQLLQQQFAAKIDEQSIQAR